MSELILSLVFGHFLADYIFQPKFINDMKENANSERSTQGLLLHVLIHFITYFFILCIIGETQVHFLVIFSITFIHFIIDYLKVKLKNNSKFNLSVKTQSTVYLLDQVLHVITIIIILNISDLISYDSKDIIAIINSFVFNLDTIKINLSLIDKISIIGTIVIFNTYFSAYLFEIILRPFKPANNSFTEKKIESKRTLKTSDKEKISEEYLIEHIDIRNEYIDSPTQAGKYIGMIERLLIMFLIAAQAYTAITFLVTVKALTRFKQFEDKCFAEYYLIGSLLSILFGVISGYLTTWLIR